MIRSLHHRIIDDAVFIARQCAYLSRFGRIGYVYRSRIFLSARTRISDRKISFFRVVFRFKYKRMDVFFGHICRGRNLKICEQFACFRADRYNVFPRQSRIIHDTVFVRLHLTDILFRIGKQNLQLTAIFGSALAQVRYDQTFPFIVFLHLKHIFVRMLSAADIPVIPARYEIRYITVLTILADMFCVADTVLRRFYHLCFVIMSRRFDVIRYIPVRAVRADVFRIAIHGTRRADRIRRIGVSRRGRFVAAVRILTHRASISGVPACRTRRRQYFRFVTVTERLRMCIAIRIPAREAGMRRISRFRARRQRCRILISMPRRGRVPVRIFIPAHRAEMRRVPLVRTGRFHHHFRICMFRSVRELVFITRSAQRTDIFRISLRRTGRLVHHAVAVFVLAYRRFIRCRRNTRNVYYPRQQHSRRQHRHAH